MTITTAGDVGIGTVVPSASLHIFASDGLEGTTPDTDGDDFVIESNADTGLSIISGEASGETGAVIFGHASDSFAAGLVYQAHTNQLSLQTQQASNTIRIATGNNDESFIFSGFNFSGSIASTGSFGALIGDGSQLTGVTATPDATLVSGSFEGGGSTNISGSLTSTGSFGSVVLPDFGKALFGVSEDIQIYHNGGGNSNIENHSGDLYFTQYTDDGDIYFRTDNGSGGVAEYLRFDGGATSIILSKNTEPGSDDAVDLGSASKRFQDVFAVQTTVGAVFETGLRSKGIGKEETGTIVVWRNGELVPCDKSEDTMVMGVVKQGKDEPIVMGAEPVLVTGDIKEGDFITTSTKLGHGKKLENGYLLKKEMFGKVIAQALENASGNSSLIKCMIRKM
jgi:hypothetical protein